MNPAARATATATVALLVAGTLPRGGPAFALAVLGWVAVVVVDAAVLAGRGGRRPLVPAAAVAAVGAPGVVLATGSMTWERVPLILAATVMATFVMALFTPRRHDATITVSVTLLIACITGLGGAGVLVMRSVSAGFRWTGGLLLLSVVPHAAATVAGHLRGTTAALPVRVVSGGAIGGALLLALNPPFGLIVTVVLTLVGLGAGSGAAVVTATLRGTTRDPRSRPSGPAILVAPLLAAPVAAFVALATSA